MNKELLHLIEKHTDTLIEQTKTKAQKTIEFKMNKQMETLFFSPPLTLVEEGKCLLAVTPFEATNSVFNITHRNNSFSISMPGRWRIPNYLPERNFDKLKDILKLRSENDFDLYVEEVIKRGKKYY